MSYRINYRSVPVYNAPEGRLWVREAEPGDPDVTAAMLSLRAVREDGTEQNVTAYVDRNTAKDLIVALQYALDAAGPEPIVEPEGATELIDSHGDTWKRNADGTWDCTADQGGEALDGHLFSGKTFQYIVSVYGPVRPFRVEELPAVSA